MKKQITSWLLVLVLCLGLTVPAAAAEEKVTVGDKAYETVLDAILSEQADKPVTVALSGDVALTAAVVLGESKVDDKTVTVASHNVTVDLNCYTRTRSLIHISPRYQYNQHHPPKPWHSGWPRFYQ